MSVFRKSILLIFLFIFSYTTVYAADLDTSIEVPVIKAATNNKLKNKDAFVFELSPQTPNAPMPKNTEGKEVQQITISSADSKSFGKIIFDEPGEYSYQIRQIAGNNRNYLYDTSVYTMTVFVTELNNKLEAVTILTKGLDGEKQNEILFTNTYKVPSGQPPTTRDTANVQVYFVLILLMGGLFKYMFKKDVSK